MSVYSNLIIAQGATHLWKLDETSGPFQDSVGTLSLTIDGTTVTPNQLGAVGRCPYFVTGGNLTSVTDTTMNYVAANNFSWSLWMRQAASGNIQGLIGKRQSGSGLPNFAAFLFSTTADSLNIDLGGNQTRWNTGWVPTVNAWYHVAFTYEIATNRRRLYINGVQFATDNTTTAPTDGTGSTPFKIGVLPGTTSAFYGNLDEVAIFENKLLSPAEIAAQYNTSFPFLRVFDGTNWNDADKRVIS